MPLSITEVNAITTQKILLELYDTYFQSSPTIYWYKEKRRMKPYTGGVNIQVPIVYSKLKGGPLAPGGTVDTSYIETTTAMVFVPKMYYVSVPLRLYDLGVNSGDVAVLDLVTKNLTIAGQTMIENFAIDFFRDGQGTVSPSISVDGFLAAYDDGTNYPQYGGVTRSFLSNTANTGINGYFQNVSGAISYTLLTNAVGFATKGQNFPDFIAMPQNLFNSLQTKLLPAQRVQDETSSVFSASFTSLRLGQRTRLVVDDYCPTNTVFGLNTSQSALYTHTSRLLSMGFTGFKEYGANLDYIGQVPWMGNLVVENPRFGFVLTNVTP